MTGDTFTGTSVITTGASMSAADVIKGIGSGDSFVVTGQKFASPAVASATTFLSAITANGVALTQGTLAANGTFTAGDTSTDIDYLVQWADGTNIDAVVLDDVTGTVSLVGAGTGLTVTIV